MHPGLAAGEHAESLDQGHGEGSRDRGLAPHHAANDARQRLGRDPAADVPGRARQDRAHATPPVEPCGEDHELRIRDLGGQPREASDAADPRQLVVDQYESGRRRRASSSVAAQSATATTPMSARRSSTSRNASLTPASEHAISTRIAGLIRKPLKAREVEGERRDGHAPGGPFTDVTRAWGDSS
jgi:hypothetical protein